MKEAKSQHFTRRPCFLRAEDLAVRFLFAADTSEEGKQRSQQANDAIAIIASLANRRGRPRKLEEQNEAAA